MLRLSMLVAVAWLGLYEGIYNHLLQNIVFAVRVSNETFRWLLPPAICEPPGDSLFELPDTAPARTVCRLDRGAAVADVGVRRR